MKCIVYISKATNKDNKARVVPSGLSEIFRVSRKNNVANDITGMLSYRNGYYIQVIEGRDIAVNQLLSKLRTDSRHKDFQVILDSFISERMFSEWSMKLVQSVNNEPNFVELMKKNSATISRLSAEQRKVLDIFYTDESSPKSVSRGYEGKDLMLLAWPDLTILKPSPVIIELCARLTKQSHSYQNLLESKDFGTKQQLDKILKKFETFEILKVMESLDQDNVIVAKSKPNKFYSKMKNFLGM